MASKPSITRYDLKASRSTLLKRAEAHIGAVSANDDVLFAFPHSNVRIVNSGIVNSVSDAVDASNYWSVQLVDKGVDGSETVNLLSAAFSNATSGTAITAYVPWEAVPDQNRELEKGSVLIFQITKAASATALADVSVFVEYQEDF
jgi:hypothetical protein